MKATARAGGGARPAIELYLSRDAYATGRNLSGVVLFRLERATNIRSLTVSVTGCEKPAGASLTRALRRKESFFHREVLLSGMDQPRLVSDRVSQLWNSILGRDTGTRLSPGEHIYPFSTQLPASLPSSYEGRAGRIDYRVCVRVQFPAGGGIKAFAEVPIVFAPRVLRARPVAVSHPTAGGSVHSQQANASLTIDQRAVELGQVVTGRFSVANPQQTSISRIQASLEMCEWVRLAAERELHRDRVDTKVIQPSDPTAATIEGEFDLRVPQSACPTVEGTTISVIWLLKLQVETSPPIELKTPILVYSAVPDAGTMKSEE